MDSGLRLFYAVAGYYHCQHRPPLNGKKPGGEPAAHAYGDCLLCADRCRDAPCQRLAGGQSGGAQYLLHRYRAVYRGFAVLRDGEYAGSAGNGTRSAGRRWGYDGASRATDGDEDRPARAVYGGNDFCDLTRPGGSAAWSGAGRHTRGICLLALDFPHQPAGGHYWRYRHPGADAQLHPADAAL